MIAIKALIVLGGLILSPQQSDQDNESKEESAHQDAEAELYEFTESINQLLGTDGGSSTDSDFYLHFGLLGAYDTRDMWKLKPHFNLKMVLPGFQRRLRLLFNSSNKRDYDSDFEHWKSASKAESSSLGLGTKGLGLEFEFFDLGDFRLLAQEYLNIHFDRWPDPTSRLLLDVKHVSKNAVFSWRLGPHWDPSDGFGALLEPRLSLRTARRSLIRLYSGFQYWYDEEDIFKEESLTFIEGVSNSSALLFDFTFQYELFPYQAGDLSYSVGFRQRCYYPWLTLQILPSLILDGRRNWDFVYRIALGAQVSFGSEYSKPIEFLSF